MLKSSLAALLFITSALTAAAPREASAAAPSETNPPATVDLAAIQAVVRPEGPLLWKVARGNATLWILPIPSSLPKDLQVNMDKIEEIAAASSTLLALPTPRLEPDVDGPTGLRSAIGLIADYRRIRQNPEKKTLREVLPATDYSAWLQMVGQHGRIARPSERLRPYFAAIELEESLSRKHGFVKPDAIWTKLLRMSRASGTQVMNPDFPVRVDLRRDTTRGFARTSWNDAGCFRANLRRLSEFPADRLDQVRAWSEGDLAGMTKMAGAAEAAAACSNALRPLGVEWSHLIASKKLAWLAAVDKAMKPGTTSFAMLRIEDALDDQGFIAALEASGADVSIE